jgi:type IV pilus assembly protein PilW
MDSGNRMINRRRSGGLTLIELMVALVLSLMVAQAIIYLYLSNTAAATFQRGAARVGENGRFAVDMISRSIRMAGYNDPQTSTVPTSPALQGTDGSSGVLLSIANLKSSSDTIGIRYEGGTNIHDCQGQSVAAGSWVTNVYAVTSDDNLVCAVQLTASDGTVTNQSALTLAEGVENVQTLYGEDLSGDGVANRYVPAGSVSNWSGIATVQVAMLVNSVTNALPSSVDSGGALHVESVCIGCTTFSAVNDALIRGEFITTVNVRN